MKEQCPKCGNWVEGKKVATFARKMTRGAVKKGSAVATGMAIGSIIPGAGTIIGGALGLAASALMEDTVNDVADLVEDIAFDETKYEFNCPKCGYYWNNENSHAVKSTNNNYQLESPDYVNAHEVWLEAFNRYFKIRDAVLQSFDSYTFWEQSYVEIAYEEINERVKSEYYFLIALCSFEYAVKHLSSEEYELKILKNARHYILKAINLFDTIEYQMIRGAISKVLAYHCPDDDPLLVEYAKEHVNAECIIGRFDDNYSFLTKDFYKHWLSYPSEVKNDAEITLDYCFEHLDELKKDPEQYQTFINQIVEKRNTGDESNDSAFLFLEAMVRFNMTYSEGINAKLEYAKAKAAINLAVNKWPDASEFRLLQSVICFEPAYGKLDRELYDFDIKTIADNKRFLEDKGDTFVLKKEFYENTYKHFDLYLENPVNFLSLINNVQETTDTTILTSEEQEYLEEVKICLEEDNEISPRERRLLDRLCTKLNISEERAKELEEFLKTPQLTEEEQEYLEEYKLCLEEDGEVSSKERRLLDRLRDKLGISVERAKELENTF